MKNPAPPKRQFTALAACVHPAVEDALLPVMVSVKNFADFSGVSAREVAAAGIHIPPRHQTLLLPWELNLHPPLEQMRPSGVDETSFFKLGLVQIPEDQTVCALFCSMTRDPAKDRVVILNSDQLALRTLELEEDLKNPAYDRDGIQSMIKMLQPIQASLVEAQVQMYPPAANRLN